MVRPKKSLITKTWQKGKHRMKSNLTRLFVASNDKRNKRRRRYKTRRSAHRPITWSWWLWIYDKHINKMAKRRKVKSYRQVVLDSISSRTSKLFDGFDENIFKIDSRLIPKGSVKRKKGQRKSYKRSSVLGRRGKSGFWSWFI